MTSAQADSVLGLLMKLSQQLTRIENLLRRDRGLEPVAEPPGPRGPRPAAVQRWPHPLGGEPR